MSFLLYLVGFIVFIAGLAWLATALGISQTYIMIGAVILLGIAISAPRRARAPRIRRRAETAGCPGRTMPWRALARPVRRSPHCAAQQRGV